MQTLGRSDRVDLPGLGLEDIQAKIDTGAYTSSLHCLRAEIIEGELEFVLLDEEHPEFTGIKYRFKKFHQREIKNSFGEAEVRFVIKTKVKIFDEIVRAEFSLSNRLMKILVGGRNDAYIGANIGIATDAAKTFLLQDTQESGL